MSQDATTDRPRKQQRKDWNSFDLEMITCAKHQYVVDFFFVTDIPKDLDGGDGVSSLTGTVQVVDVYFLKIAIPTEEGTQREVWIAKQAIAMAEAHKIKPPAQNS